MSAENIVHHFFKATGLLILRVKLRVKLTATCFPGEQFLRVELLTKMSNPSKSGTPNTSAPSEGPLDL